MKKNLFAALLLGVIASAHSGPSDYQCLVHNVSDVDSKGLMKTGEPNLQLLFLVRRKTGEIIGAPFHNQTSTGVTTVQVLDYGSNEQAFKVVSVYKDAYTSVDYLQIDEFVDSSEKPFLGITRSRIFSGTCR